MSRFYGAYVTTKSVNPEVGSTEFLLHVYGSIGVCKAQFCKWYERVDYVEVSVRYVPVDVAERV